MRKLFKTLALVATLALAAIGFATDGSPWVYVGCYPNTNSSYWHNYGPYTTNVPDYETATFANVDHGTSCELDLQVDYHSINTNWFASANYDAGSYFDFKWIVPYQYPSINCVGTVTITVLRGDYGNDDWASSTWTTDYTVAGVTTSWGNRFSDAGTSTYTASWNTGTNYQDGAGYYHSYVYFPAAATAAITEDAKLYSTYHSYYGDTMTGILLQNTMKVQATSYN